MTDRVTGVLGIVLALAFGIAGSTYESDFLTDPLGPTAFPVMLAVVLGVLSVILFIKPGEEPDWPPLEVWLRKLATIAAMVIYTLVLESFGFIVSSFLLVTCLVLLMSGRPKQALATGLIASIGLYILFDPLLGLPLPTGSLFAGLSGA